MSLFLLIGLVGGVSMGAMAGARRTDSSFPIFLASTNPETLQVFTGIDNPALGFTTGYNPALDQKIANLPLVLHVAVQVGYDGNIDLSKVRGATVNYRPGETPPSVIGGSQGLSMDRVTVVAGRLFSPRKANEAIMNAQAAREWGLHVGSAIAMPFYSDAQANSPNYHGLPYKIASVKIVGLVVFANTVVQDDINALGSGVVMISPTLNNELSRCCAYYSGVALQLKGGATSEARVRAEIAKATPIGKLAVGGGPTPTTVTEQALRAIEPEAVALGIFAVIAGLAALLIAGLLVSRVLRVGAAETEILRALGADRAIMLGDELLGLLASVISGALLAALVAVALSPLAPLGPVRPVYPHRGVDFDWTVLGLGAVVLVVILGSLALLLARRELRRLASRRASANLIREPAVVRFAATSGLPVSAVVGLRFALEPGRGRNVAPLRSAILGALLAVTVLVATVTFGAGLDNLVSHPPLFGWNWDYALFSGFAGQEDLPLHQSADIFNQDKYVKAWSGVNLLGAKLDALHVKFMAERPGAPVGPPLLSGHGLEAANQVVVGRMTLAALHKSVGDTVRLSGGGLKTRRLLIVGTATMTPITSGLEMGSGALVATSDFPLSLLNVQQQPIPGPNVLLIRMRPGTTPSVALRTLGRDERKIDAVKGDPGSAGGIVAVLRPAEIVNYRSMGTTPAILGGGLAVGAALALALALIASVRQRRRDLALLKTLGFTRRQLASVVAWQSGVAVGLGTAVGLPIGVVLGRMLWNLFAHDINAVPRAIVPLSLIALIAVGALGLALGVAAVPGRMAARTPTALVLREE